jgi:hypothetical protein
MLEDSKALDVTQIASDGNDEDSNSDESAGANLSNDENEKYPSEDEANYPPGMPPR